MTLSLNELYAINALLKQELSIIKKYVAFSKICTDRQLKVKFEQIAAEHQTHYDTLITKLN